MSSKIHLFLSVIWLWTCHTKSASNTPTPTPPVPPITKQTTPLGWYVPDNPSQAHRPPFHLPLKGLVRIPVDSKQGIIIQIECIRKSQPRVHHAAFYLRAPLTKINTEVFDCKKPAQKILIEAHGFSLTGFDEYVLFIEHEYLSVAAESFVLSRYSKDTAPKTILENAQADRIQKTGFLRPPQGIRPNCGPEHRRSFGVTIQSKEQFVDFIKNRLKTVWRGDGANWLTFDSYKTPAGSVDWARLGDRVQTFQEAGFNYYQLTYVPAECHNFTFIMSELGHASLYGCCGK